MSLIVKANLFLAKKLGNNDANAVQTLVRASEIALILTEFGDVKDEEVLAAALLLPLAARVGAEEIEFEFGPRVSEIVAEFAAGNSLAKEEQLKQQLVRASALSKDAVLIALAQQLHLLCRIKKNTPDWWTKERIQGNFAFARAFVRRVCNGDFNGVFKISIGIGLELQKILSSEISISGKTFNCCPPADGDEEELLQNFYALTRTL